jgi:LL-diaminopimelate aminotransferase
MPAFTRRFESLPPYPLATIPQRKRDLLARGVDVIDLGAGDADLAPPAAAVAALQEAAAMPAMHRYGFGLGNPAYREAAAAWMQLRFGVACDPYTELVPLIGSKEGIAHLAFAYLQAGDVAIIPDPGYLAYLGGTLLGEATPYLVPLRPENGFLIDVDAIPADVVARARVLFLNYPNNPTAAIASREYLAGVVAWCARHDVLLVYDNAYSELAFDGYVPPSIFEIDGAREVAIEFHSLSKTYNMTGWRCGWAVARRDAAVASFRAAGFACDTPAASMYLWLPLPDGVGSVAFHDRLTDDAGVVVLPGRGLGAGGEGFFRVSFIATPARIAEAAVRAGAVLTAMRDGR